MRMSVGNTRQKRKAIYPIELFTVLQRVVGDEDTQDIGHDEKHPISDQTTFFNTKTLIIEKDINYLQNRYEILAAVHCDCITL